MPLLRFVFWGGNIEHCVCLCVYVLCNLRMCVCVCVFVTRQRGGGVCASEALRVEIGLWRKTEHTLALTSPSRKVTKLGPRVRKDKKIVTQARIKSTITLWQRPFLLMTLQYWWLSSLITIIVRNTLCLCSLIVVSNIWWSEDWISEPQHIKSTSKQLNSKPSPDTHKRSYIKTTENIYNISFIQTFATIFTILNFSPSYDQFNWKIFLKNSL